MRPMNIQKFFLLLAVSWFLAEAPVFAYGKGAPTLQSASYDTTLIPFVEAIHADIDHTLEWIGTQSDVEKESLDSFVQLVNNGLKKLSKSPEARQYRLLHQEVIKRTVSERTYVDCSHCRTPSFKGYQCSECGIGSRESWAISFGRGASHVFSCGEVDSRCCMVWCTPLGAGVECYAYQAILEPFMPYSWDCNCALGSVGCPLNHQIQTAGVKAQLTSLKTNLGNFIVYLRKPKASDDVEVMPLVGSPCEGTNKQVSPPAPMVCEPSAPPPPTYTHSAIHSD